VVGKTELLLIVNRSVLLLLGSRKNKEFRRVSKSPRLKSTAFAVVVVVGLKNLIAVGFPLPNDGSC